ncbi:MAG: hypothetical protein JEZ11_04910 [Desulfobacterales bacterium]|nr:hypothetical protein [Desulfobacterales bacterium]
MPRQIDNTTWIWTIVMDPEKEAQILGQNDTRDDISFIPAFLNKEDAQQGLIQLHCERGRKYEPQAMLYEDLLRYALDSQFLIYLLDGDGKILDILPTQYDDR